MLTIQAFGFVDLVHLSSTQYWWAPLSLSVGDSKDRKLLFCLEMWFSSGITMQDPSHVIHTVEGDTWRPWIQIWKNLSYAFSLYEETQEFIPTMPVFHLCLENKTNKQNMLFHVKYPATSIRIILPWQGIKQSRHMAQRHNLVNSALSEKHKHWMQTVL